MNQATDILTPDFTDVLAAAARIKGHVLRTEVRNDPAFDRLLGCQLWCKCENLQHTGAFKFRGASNAILALREQGINDDVATHSSGNHGAALALAAAQNGRKAHIVMPSNAVTTKVAAVQSHGAEVIFCEPNQAAREAGLARLVAQGLIPIPPYDHPHIIPGQGTAVLELLQDHPQLEVVMTPVGGGGLISGSSLAARALKTDMLIYAAEPSGAADTAASLKQGHRVDSWQPDTIADGLRALIGHMTFPIIQANVDAVLTVSETGIRQAMQLTWQYLELAIEPSAAVVIAAMLEHPERFAGRRVGVVLSGGNFDASQFPLTGPGQ